VSLSFVRHWGVLVLAFGGLIVSSAYAPNICAPVLIAAALEKLAMVLFTFFRAYGSDERDDSDGNHGRHIYHPSTLSICSAFKAANCCVTVVPTANLNSLSGRDFSPVLMARRLLPTEQITANRF
jgi:hypothetical protein